MFKDTFVKFRPGKRTQFNITKLMKYISEADFVPCGKIG